MLEKKKKTERDEIAIKKLKKDQRKQKKCQGKLQKKSKK